MKKAVKLVGAASLSIALIMGASTSALAKPYNLNSIKGGGFTTYAIKDTLTWNLLGDQTDPNTNWSITVGYPNVKLYAKNTGSAEFRVEVKHIDKNKVIFNKIISADSLPYEFINNDSSPTVPSGNYKVTIYGGSGKPKGQVVLKSSDTPW